MVQVGDLKYTRLEVDVGVEETTHVEIDLRGDSAINVILENIPDQERDGLFVKVVQAPALLKRAHHFSGWTDGRNEIRFDHLETGDYRIVASSASGQVLGVAEVHLGTKAVGVVVVDLSRNRIQVRVENPEGAPLAGVHGSLYRKGEAETSGYITNGNGVMELAWAGNEPSFLCLWKEGIGHHWNIELAYPDPIPTEPIVVVMDCKATLTVKLFDRAGPIAGQQCKLFGSGHAAEVSMPKDTDGEGLVSFKKLSPGPYQLRIEAPDHWPYYKAFDATTEGAVHEIEVPRLVQFLVEIRNANGASIQGQHIQVWSVDYDKDTKYWQDIGAMTVEPADWKTDNAGRVHIPTFPEGHFRVSTLGPDGNRVEVSVELRPGQENVALIRLP
ncbi:MAG: hypothetical protein JKY61_05600 [Planctomycetes bacterium]|nr:hypothetical protein [Planctomycetota bacterium]